MLRINVQLCVKKGCKTFILRQKYNFQEKQPLAEHAEQAHKYTGDTLKKSSPITECILTWYTFTVIGDENIGKWRSIRHYKKTINRKREGDQSLSQNSIFSLLGPSIVKNRTPFSQKGRPLT